MHIAMLLFYYSFLNKYSFILILIYLTLRSHVTMVSYTIYYDFSIIQFYLGKEGIQICETLHVHKCIYILSTVLAFSFKYANQKQNP